MQELSKPVKWLILSNILCCCVEAKSRLCSKIFIGSYHHASKEKLSELLEEQLRPIKEAKEDFIINEAMAEHIDLFEMKLVKKINEQAAKIDELKTHHSHLEGRVAILENLVKLQEIRSDEIEQYGRRLCLRVNGIPFENGERVKDFENRLQEEFSNMAMNIPKEAIGRVHRIGKKDGHFTGVSVHQQVIMRFTN